MAPPAKGPADIDPVLQRLMALHPKMIDLSLDRMLGLLERLGRPHLRLPPVVHVAGTNGKGSLVAYLRAIAEAAGYRVHAYTSPHLVRFNERIRLGGNLIGEADLTALLERIEGVNAGAPITFFEITTAAAFCAFAETPADLVLLETGLGGRLDATNVLPAPLLTAITPIGFDHQQYLGNTLAAIAGEKAGILKHARPCVVGPQPDEALAVIEARAEALQAPLFSCGRDWQAQMSAEGFVWVTAGERLHLPLPALPGEHQVRNAATAIACTRRLDGFHIPEAALRSGLLQVQWPARMQRLNHGPLLDLLPASTELWLDGGHNPMAGEALGQVLAHRRGAKTPPRPIYLICGMLNTKEAAGFLRPLAELVAEAFCIRIPDEPNALDAGDLVRAGQTVGLQATACTGIEDAAQQITSRATVSAGTEPPPLVVIAGSLYLAGQVLRAHR